MSGIKVLLLAGALACVVLAPSPALARFHLWTIEEMFSNADGTIQFVEMFDAFNQEDLLAGHTLTSGAKSFTFPSNLPTEETANRRLLIATAGFASLAGAVSPDFIIPSNFFAVGGDRLNFADVSIAEFGPGDLPVDGTHSLLADLTTAVNSPTNFAGNSGSVVVPAAHPWKNPAGALDINDDGNIFPQDVIVLVNELNANGLHSLPVPAPAGSTPPFLDPTGDDFISPQDVILVVNHLNEFGPGPRFGGLAVPEPAGALAMLSGGVLAALAVLRSRRDRLNRQNR